MSERTYTGKISAVGLADNLIHTFTTGHLMARYRVREQQFVDLQIRSRESDRGGQWRTVLTMTFTQRTDGIHVDIADHNWVGSATDLLSEGARSFRNPMRLLGRLNDVVEDVQTLQLPQQVWLAIEAYVEKALLNPDLPQDYVVCPYCNTPNEIGVLVCPACGGSLADVQPLLR
ncbi:MAG: zinc ribbon domain-containing protein [Chloroflexi bacterium]|nr:zinc ribbon domain-containing protein [Chloroflexota bacterium]